MAVEFISQVIGVAALLMLVIVTAGSFSASSDEELKMTPIWVTALWIFAAIVSRVYI